MHSVSTGCTKGVLVFHLKIGFYQTVPIKVRT